MSRAAVDMGKDPVGKVIFLMAMPAMLSMFFQNLYEFADTMFISWLGDVSLGAMGLSMPLFYLALCLTKSVQYGLIGLAGGARGDGDHRRAERLLESGLPLMLLLMLPLVFVTIPPIGQGLFRLMGAEGDLASQAYAYSFWMVLSFPVMGYFQIGEAKMVSLGDTRTPMMAQVAGNTVNLILDPLLMFGFDMGIAGAALATLIGWSMALIILIWRMKVQGHTLPRLGFVRSYINDWKRLGRIAVYTFIAQLSSPLGLILVNSVLVGFGAAALGAWTVMTRLELFSLLPVMGMGSALIAFVSYNRAAGNKRRIKQGLWASVLLAALFIFPLMMFYLLAPGIAVRPFASDPDTARLSALAIQIAATAHILYPVEMVLFGLAQGLKKSWAFLPAIVTRILVIRYPLAVFLAGIYGLAGVYWSQPLANLGGAIIAAGMIWYLVRGLERSEDSPKGDPQIMEVQ